MGVVWKLIYNRVPSLANFYHGVNKTPGVTILGANPWPHWNQLDFCQRLEFEPGVHT